MAHPVFISYARTTSRQHAEALYRELGSLAFFDTSDIETGEQFPEMLVDALLEAKVVVVFVDARYFQRWYCRKELETALKPFEILTTQAGHSLKHQETALEGIVLALPPNQPGYDTSKLLHHFPSRLGTANWPMATETQALGTLIRQRVETTRKTIGELLDISGQRMSTRKALLEEAGIPPPADLRPVRQIHLQGMPDSLHKGFVGRANDLWTIHTALTGFPGEPEPSVALFAHGGFGKTRLAAEYVQRYGPAHFPGGLFWINAERGQEGLEEQFYAILKAITPNIPSIKDLREAHGQNAVATEMVKAVTEASQRGRILVVIDNVPETQAISLNTYFPARGAAARLATSRRNLALAPEGIREVSVPSLTLPASIELLTRKIDRRALPDKEWQRIADDWVGRFPLALELLNTALQAKALTPQQLLEKADGAGQTTELDEQAEALREVVPQGMIRGVTEALQVSYEQLSPAAQKAAQLLAKLAPEPIPEQLLDTLGPDGLSPIVRTILTSRAIVMPVAGSSIPMFGTMHRVLADFLKNQPCDAQPETHIIAEAILGTMRPQDCRDPNQWALMTACVPHAEELLSGLQDNDSEQHRSTVIQLRLGLGTLASAQGRYAQAREQEEQAVSYARTHLGEEHPGTLTSMSNLASTLSDQGDYAGAVALQRTELERRQRILGEEHPSTSISAWNYLNTLLNSGDIETAVQIIRRYLLWLLERDPSTLGGTQQQIRTGVVQILESSRESAEGS